jgi:hypothetical protein
VQEVESILSLIVNGDQREARIQDPRLPEFWTLFDDDHRANLNPGRTQDGDLGGKIEPRLKSLSLSLRGDALGFVFLKRDVHAYEGKNRGVSYTP